MSTKFKLEINDFGRINNANIEINKINVMGGINASGKTTASKLLYCFLKANSLKRNDYIKYTIINKLKPVASHSRVLTEDDSLDDIIDEYEKRRKYLWEEPKNKGDAPRAYYTVLSIEPIINGIKENKDDNNLVSCTISSLLYKESLRNFTKQKNKKTTSNAKFYNNSFESVIHNNFDEDYDWNDDEFLYSTKGTIEKISDVFYIGAISIFDLDKYYTSPNDIRKPYFEYEEHIENLIKNLEDINQYKTRLYALIVDSYNRKNQFDENDTKIIEELSRISDTSFEDIKNQIKNEVNDTSISTQKWILYEKIKETKKMMELLYEDTSFEDTDEEIITMFEEGKKSYAEKIKNYEKEIEELSSKESQINKNSKEDTEINRRIFNFEKKIENIIQGNLITNTDSKFSFSSKESDNINTVNTSSGIKQIGVLELLLHNNKLKPGTFLIIDEPEINLHPEWQFKFADILVSLAKELDITIYLNSHSPMFIESIQAFTEYYDMENEVNYYLTEESENEGKYNFNKINSDELYKVYDNLGNPYDLIDQLRLEKRLGE